MQQRPFPVASEADHARRNDTSAVRLYADSRCSDPLHPQMPVTQHFYYSNARGECRQAQAWSDARGTPMVSVELVQDAPIANHEQSTLVSALNSLIDGNRRH